MGILRSITTQPIDVVALVNAIFSGLATLMSGLAAVYAVMSASRSKRAEQATVAVKETVIEVKKDVAVVVSQTNSMTTELQRLSKQEGMVEGERKGVYAGEVSARAKAEGIREGIETERASVAAANQTTAPAIVNNGLALATEATLAEIEKKV